MKKIDSYLLLNSKDSVENFRPNNSMTESPDMEDLDKYIKSLHSLIEPITKFFDKVLVMDKDEKIKNNRLALLYKLAQKFKVICDFEKL